MASHIVWYAFLITLQLSVVFSHSPDEIERDKGTTCKDSSDCKNGGTCEVNSQLCRCLNGTEGDRCQNVPECYVERCGLFGTCKYDVVRQIAVCVCDYPNHKFDPIDLSCKRTCRNSSDCVNGATCDEHSQFCHCLNRTKADRCEDNGCRFANGRTYCGFRRDASCKYDVERRTYVCVCDDKDYEFDSFYYKCKRRCQSSSDCKNGGTCQRVKYSQVCLCLKGTEGDFCEVVLVCHNSNCGYNGKCKYDIERRTAVCVCDDKDYEFDPYDRICKSTKPINFKPDDGFQPSHIWILFVALGGITLFIAIPVLIFIRRKKFLAVHTQSTHLLHLSAQDVHHY